MKHISIVLGLALFIVTGVSAQSISDVSSKDGAYKAVQTTVKDGYLSLFSGNKFRPTQAVSRKEMAIVIDQLIKNAQDSNISLTKAEIQELEHLSKSFKTEYADLKTQINTFVTNQESNTQEIKTLHHDITKLNIQLQDEIAELKKQRRYTWMGIGAAALLGIIL
jgi:septal ring factor EnvC (AmiA/AmiB activator)